MVGCDDVLRGRERADFRSAQRIGLDGRQPGFQGERVMNEPDQTMAARRLMGFSGQGSKRQTVNHDGRLDRCRQQARTRQRPLFGADLRKAIPEINQIDPVVARPQRGNDTTRVTVASGRRGEIARYRECDPWYWCAGRYHKGAS